MMLSDHSKKALFEKICNEDRISGGGGELCTYNEKRLHRAVKRFILESECIGYALNEYEGYETRIGRYVADILVSDVIFEIQTGSVRPLKKKLEYYIENTDYSVVVVIPLKKDTELLRVDRESGELISKKRSPKHERIKDKLCDLVYISEILSSGRVRVRYLEVCGEEQRYSERVRGRKSGAYDKEYFPLSLADVTEYTAPEAFSEYLPAVLSVDKGFSAAEYGKAMKLAGRKLYNTLNFFCGMGILEREKRDSKYIYSKRAGD
ncbi:MAG: hypothetical protein J6Q78_00365 [Clostridia bacterium]|nr:hypothetical protein [Clostridia bacterium]